MIDGVKVFCVAVFITAACIVVNNCDREQQAQDHALYCRMVKDGDWPDYKHVYEAECGGEKPPKFVAH